MTDERPVREPVREPAPPPHDGPRVIVAGVDGSDTSLRAAAYAWGLARRSDARLLIVHVVPVASLSTLTAGGAAAMHEAAEEVLAELRADLDRAAREYSTVRHELVVESGDAFTVLARVADERRADAVVVGASTQAGHRLVGSVAVRLVRVGRWPVTVVP
ncbi:universal stress protein [Actinomadura atramentaria]|uniref:universal stress protein n=1 Tax=Actinomadura atramentaria TaxID=1990 RepID=UPI00038285AC|nr:universal stress protein [Actinomadura atramentaria]